MSQSPSLRGSGRFNLTDRPSSINKFKSQSPSLRGSGRFQERGRPAILVIAESQSPSLRGSGRFPQRAGVARRAAASQSPSLRGSGRFSRSSGSTRRRFSSLNPLHCGAVVASRTSMNHQAGDWWCLNPLHCGAVVASPLPPPYGGGKRGSQSPSLRGSGRFRTTTSFGESQPIRLNPLHCGAVVASSFSEERARKEARLNPLHCGAVVASWKQPLIRTSPTRSQSPSLRGSGRFARSPLWPPSGPGLNPLHCGAVVASGGLRGRPPRRFVSIPFIAGQWSLRYARG